MIKLSGFVPCNLLEGRWGPSSLSKDSPRCGPGSGRMEPHIDFQGVGPEVFVTGAIQELKALPLQVEPRSSCFSTKLPTPAASHCQHPRFERAMMVCRERAWLCGRPVRLLARPCEVTFSALAWRR